MQKTQNWNTGPNRCWRVTPNRSRWCPNWMNCFIQTEDRVGLQAPEGLWGQSQPSGTNLMFIYQHQYGCKKITPPRRKPEVQLLCFRASWNPKQSSVSVSCSCYSVKVIGLHKEPWLSAMCLVTAWSWLVRGYRGENKQKHPATRVCRNSCTYNIISHFLCPPNQFQNLYFSRGAALEFNKRKTKERK